MENHNTTVLLPLLIVSILAFIIPILTSWLSKTIKIKIPAIVGEIICGIIIGKSCLKLIPDTNSIPWLSFLALFGFTYLMFLSGLEIDLEMITSNNKINDITNKSKNYFKQPIVLALIYFIFSLTLALVFALIFYSQGYIKSWPFVALMLTTISVGIVVPVMKESNLSKSLFGQTIFVSALVADFITMFLITALMAFHTKQSSGKTFIALILIGLMLFVIYKLHISKTFDKLILLFSPLKNIFSELTHATTQIKVRGAIALMVTFIAISQLLGVETILGAFIAGMLATMILGKTNTSQIEMKLDAIGYGFFIPIFFISVGINLDLSVFSASHTIWMFLLLLIVSAFVVKIIPSLIFLNIFKLKESLSAGILLSSTLSLVIAASMIAYREGLITERFNTSVVIMAIITCIIAPIVFNKLNKTDDNVSRDFTTLIVGGTYSCRILAQKLLDENQHVIVVAFNQNDYDFLKKFHIPALLLKERTIEEIIKIDMDDVKSVVVVTTDDTFNLEVCRKIKENHVDFNMLSIVNKPENVQSFIQSNVSPISVVDSSIEKIFNKIIVPDGSTIFSRDNDEVHIADLLLTNQEFDNVPLNKLRLPGDALIVLVKRTNESFIPHGDSIIKLNDHLTLVGNTKALSESIELLGVSPINYCPIDIEYR